MKKFITLSVLFSLFLAVQVNAQLREDALRNRSPHNSIVNTKAPTVQNGLNNFFKNNVTMSHSYSMNFGSYGGSFQNVNAYTNTLQFAFSPQLTGRLDVSFLHSPFGQSGLMDTNNNLGGEILIRNAELNYQLGKNTHISLQYQQLPAAYGFYNPYGYHPYGYSRFGHPAFWY